MTLSDFRRFLKQWQLANKGYASSSKIRHAVAMQPPESSWPARLVVFAAVASVWLTSWLPLAAAAPQPAALSQCDLLIYEGLRGFCLLLFILLGGFCLKGMRPDLFRLPRELLLLTVVIVIQILVTNTALDFYDSRWRACGIALPATLPLAFGALLLAPLLGLRTAFCASIYTSLLAAAMVAVQNGGTENAGTMVLLVFVEGVIISIAGTILMRRLRRRSYLVITGDILCLLTLVFVVLSAYPAPLASQAKEWKPNLIAVLANGFGMVILANLLLPFLEYIFNMTTDQSLLELNDLNHPLLKRLQIEAPGTYHHSLMVATLAEAAATAIGVNPLLTRVCAYFHDIGKLAHPEYFAENARHDDSPHEILHPHMSSMIILNHVKEGLDLAYKYKLKKAIRDAIVQHHGTSLVYYFYHKAQEQGLPGKPVGEEDYRYPGPLPQRKEIALISLADACEATIRSLEKPTPQKIRIKVDEIVRSRILDHQLEDADLTFAELAIAKETMIKTLSGMMHGRVQYPSQAKAPHEHPAVQADDKAPFEQS
jgi:putative nucleotidyltransferase with HDIG domain